MSKETERQEQEAISAEVYALLISPVTDNRKLALIINFSDLLGVSALYTSDSNFRTLTIKGTEEAAKGAATYHFPNEISQARFFEFAKVEDFIKTASKAFKHREANATGDEMAQTKILLDVLNQLHSRLFPTLEESASRMV